MHCSSTLSILPRWMWRRSCEPSFHRTPAGHLPADPGVINGTHEHQMCTGTATWRRSASRSISYSALVSGCAIPSDDDISSHQMTSTARGNVHHNTPATSRQYPDSTSAPMLGKSSLLILSCVLSHWRERTAMHKRRRPVQIRSGLGSEWRLQQHKQNSHRRGNLFCIGSTFAEHQTLKLLISRER